MSKLITPLVGHESLKKHLENDANADCNLIIHLNAGAGRTTVLRYMAEHLLKKCPRRFGEVEKILEYRFSGSQEDAEHILEDIYNKSERYNSFHGILALPGDDFAKHINSKPVRFMFDHLKKVAEDSIIVFFLSDEYNCNEAVLVSKLNEFFDNSFHEMKYEAYSQDELNQIEAIRRCSRQGKKCRRSDEQTVNCVKCALDWQVLSAKKCDKKAVV